ncbi:MAG: AcrR family transcriptional regulator [Candidatus Aldehydirespiratoraceae bacterium]|jgi:AcrR family transcriptional regulator
MSTIDSVTGLASHSLDPRAIRTRQRIGAAVYRLLIEEGWDAVTHQRVAEEAGCGRYTVYRHFPERTDLLRNAGGFDQVVEADQLTGDTRADLISQLTAYRDAMNGDELPSLILSTIERAERDPEVEDLRNRLTRASSAVARAIVERAQEVGDLDPNVDPDDLLAMLGGPVSYTRLQQNRRLDDWAVERIVDSVLQTFAPLK